MPAQTWEEILAEAKLSADERKLIDNIAQRVPEFKEGRLRQSDYSRRLTEIEARKKDYDAAIAHQATVQEWFDERKPSWDKLKEAGMVDDEFNPLWLTEREKLQKELDDAKKAALAGAVDMDPAELDKRVREIVKAAGGVTSEELKGLYASESKKIAQEVVDAKYLEVQTEFNTKTIPFTMSMAASNGLAAQDYERVTGEEWNDDKQKELYALMAKENNMNPRAAMKIMLKPVIEKKEREAEIKAEGRKEAERILRERGQLGDNEPFIPIPEKTTQPKGSLQKMLEASMGEGDTETLIREGGHKAAAELQAEGKY